MHKLFTSFNIGKKMQLKNRFVRSATTSYWSTNEGILTSPILDYYEKLARGGVGLIIKGHSYVNNKAKAHRRQSGLSEKKHIPKMRELTEIVHHYDVPILAQLNHAGCYAISERLTASRYRTIEWHARGASIEEIKAIINDFANSAELAMEAGFDGIQIHAAHGYLISQFLSDIVNKRTDNYGGSLENRARLLIEIYEAIRDKLGKETVIGVKINTDDFAKEGGFTIKECIEVCKMLKKDGIDFIELSGGGINENRELRMQRGRYKNESSDAIKEPLSSATFAGHAMKVRKELGNSPPLILVDGIRTKETMDALLDNNIVDLIAMSKPFVIEPDIPNKIKNGQKKSACIDCGKCTEKKYFAKQMLRCFYLTEI